MIIFRKPEEYKRFKSGSGGGGAGGGKKGLLAGGHMVLINLKEDDETLVGIEYKGKRLCWGFYGRSGGTSIGAFPQDPAGSW